MKHASTYKIFFLNILVLCFSFAADASTSIIKVKISSAAYSDEIAVRFMSGATTGYDGCCDAWKLFSGNAAVPNLFTRTSDGDELSINSLPSLSGTNNVDLFVRSGAAATYSITSTMVDSFSTYTLITLIDNVTGNTYNLKALNIIYAINLPVMAVTDPARFTVKVTPPSILPVELTMFTALAEKQSVLLSWITASETNNGSFIVERADGSAFSGSGEMQFVQVGILPGAGNSNAERSYEFNDRPEIRNAEYGTLYYRLKQVDLNGAYKYFGPIAVTPYSYGQANVNVYPSVSSGTFFVSGYTGNTLASVYSLDGRLICSRQMPMSTGEETIDLQGMANGIYVVKILNETESVTQKIIINH